MPGASKGRRGGWSPASWERRGTALLPMPQFLRRVAFNLFLGTVFIAISLALGMAGYAQSHPHTDILLFEPNRADADMFFTNLFSYSSRRRLCEHAYQKTREELWKRRHQLAPVLEGHGVTIRADVLRDHKMTLVKSLRRSRGVWRETASTAATRLLTHTLDDLERWLRYAAVPT